MNNCLETGPIYDIGRTSSSN